MFPQYRNQPPFYYLKSRDGRTYILSPMDSATINYDKNSAHFRAITTILAKEYKPTLQWVAPIRKQALWPLFLQ